jgi:hypothetical protein
MPQPISSSSSQSPHYPPPPETEEVRPTEASCEEELAEVTRASAALAGSIAALVAATPTIVGVLPGIVGFIQASLYMGKAAADLANCRDQGAGPSPASSSGSAAQGTTTSEQPGTRLHSSVDTSVHEVAVPSQTTASQWQATPS